MKVATTLHGRSLVPLLRGENLTDWRKSIYYHYYDPGHAVNPHYGLRTDDHTLAFFPKHQEWELYDLNQDPQQLRNLAGEATWAALLAGLKDELVRLRKDFGDTDDDGAPTQKRKNVKKATVNETMPSTLFRSYGQTILSRYHLSTSLSLATPTELN